MKNERLYLVCPATPGHGYAVSGELVELTADEAARISDGDQALAQSLDIYANEGIADALVEGGRYYPPTEIISAPPAEVDDRERRLVVPGWEDWAVDALPADE